jgi:hypothetical protein
LNRLPHAAAKATEAAASEATEAATAARPAKAVIERRQCDDCKKCDKGKRHNDLLRPRLLMLRPRLEPTLKKRLVVDGEINGEACSCRGEYRKEKPALPIMERPCRPKNERNEKCSTEYRLHYGLPIERSHFQTLQPPARRQRPRRTITISNFFANPRICNCQFWQLHALLLRFTPPTCSKDLL